MVWLVHRSSDKTGSYEKLEDKWVVDQRTKDDRTAATHLGAIHASLCGNKPRNARADTRAAQFKPTEQGCNTHKTRVRHEGHVHCSFSHG